MCRLCSIYICFDDNHGRCLFERLDSICFDQKDITSSLKVLPVNIQTCEKVLVLCGPTYANRLWYLILKFLMHHCTTSWLRFGRCVWELYTCFAFAPAAQALARLHMEHLGSETSDWTKDQLRSLDLGNVPQLLRQFKIENAKCYDPNEQVPLLFIVKNNSIQLPSSWQSYNCLHLRLQAKIRKIIREGNESVFEGMIRNIGMSMQRMQAKQQKREQASALRSSLAV